MSEPKETTQVSEDFYAIALTITSTNVVFDHGRKQVRRDDRTVYFKADRYSAYSGRLQAEWRILDAKPFKTAKGAHAAIQRLKGKGTIKESHSPKVIHYTESIVYRYETVDIHEPAPVGE